MNRSMGNNVTDNLSMTFDQDQASKTGVDARTVRRDAERGEKIAEWIERTERNLHSGQSAPIESKRADGRGHRPESGISAASRELGIEATDAKRAVKVASLPPEAKEAASETGLDKNRTALLKAAKAKTPERAVATIREVRRSSRRDVPANRPKFPNKISCPAP